MSEQIYDDLIAPKLLEIGRLCEQHGLSLVARVEYEPDCAGITQINVDGAGIGQKLTQLAAHSRGNIDSLCLAAMKRFDCSQSAVLFPYLRAEREPK